MNSKFSQIRQGIFILLGITDLIFGKKTDKTFALCYHSFGPDKWVHGVDKRQLSFQLEELTKKFTPLTGKDLEQIVYKNQPSGDGFVMTIDDGYKDVYSIKKITQEYNVKPILFLLADPEKVNRTELENKKSFLNKKQIKDLIKIGWEIGCHSSTHSDFYSLKENEIEYEVIGSKSRLEKALGIKIRYFAYPKGRYSQRILKAVKKAGYKLAFTMDDGYITSKSNPWTLPRVGINRTHSRLEFPSLYSPTVMSFRAMAKKMLLKGGQQ